jgi:hypothetical protein
MADCGCSNSIPVTNDCSDCATVECPISANSSCIIYNGDFLDNLEITPGQGLNDVLSAINTALEAEIFEDVITVTSAQIKLLFSTPKTLIVAPGSGKYLEIISISIKLVSGGTTVYTVPGANLRFKSLNATNPMFVLSDAMLTSSNTSRISKPIFYTTGVDTMRENDPFVLDILTSSPTLGDYDASVYLTYVIKTI